MKFKRPTQDLGSAPHSQGSFVGKPNLRPDWLRDWIANKGKWVQLACGHKVDLKWPGQYILEGLDGVKEVVTNCEPCGQFSAIERGLSYREYRGIPTAVTPDEPMF